MHSNRSQPNQLNLRFYGVLHCLVGVHTYVHIMHTCLQVHRLVCGNAFGGPRLGVVKCISDHFLPYMER